MALPGSGTIWLSQLQDEFGGSNPVYMSEYYRGGGLVTSNNGNVPTSGTIYMSQFYGAQRLQYFPDSFSMSAYLYDSYGARYFYSTVTVAHLSQATFSGYSANVASIDELTNPAGIGTTTNSQGVPCEYFDFYTSTQRGCQNGNNQQHYTTVRVRALPGSYETYTLSHTQSQWGC